MIIETNRSGFFREQKGTKKIELQDKGGAIIKTGRIKGKWYHYKMVGDLPLVSQLTEKEANDFKCL